MRSTNRAVQTPRARRRRNHQTTPLRARDLTLGYVVATAATVSSLAFPLATPIVYVGAGVWFSRHVSRHARWALLHNNIQDVSRFKSRLILTWPAEIPSLIGRVALIRHL
jgi:hypothetical protein